MDRARALAFRLAGHHLHERLPPGSAERAAAACGLQDLPPGWVGVALAARVQDARPEDLDALVLVPSRRGAVIACPESDLAVFTTALAPPDEAAARAIIGSAVQPLDEVGVGALEALDRVSAAIVDALAAGPLERDPFHQALRERLPGELLWWCRNCQSHHVHPLLWRATGVKGVLAVAGRSGRTTLFSAPPPIPPFDDPEAELARRFLRCYGPARPKHLAEWAGISGDHARLLLDRVAGELREVDGGLLLEADAGRLDDPPAASGVRLLPGYDPYLDQRDRETLFPDREIRSRMRKAIGNPGALLVDGELAGLWRPEKRRRRLVVAVEPFRPLARAVRAAIEAEAALIAPHRGSDSADVRFVERSGQSERW
jgi:hypothetical protein